MAKAKKSNPRGRPLKVETVKREQARVNAKLAREAAKFDKLQYIMPSELRQGIHQKRTVGEMRAIKPPKIKFTRDIDKITSQAELKAYYKTLKEARHQADRLADDYRNNMFQALESVFGSDADGFIEVLDSLSPEQFRQAAAAISTVNIDWVYTEEEYAALLEEMLSAIEIIKDMFNIYD